MEAEPDSLFSVNINVEKLSSFLQEIVQTVQHQDKKIQGLMEHIAQTTKHLESSLASQRDSLVLETARVNQLLNRDRHFITLCLEESDKKAEKRIEGMIESLHAVERDIASLKTGMDAAKSEREVFKTESVMEIKKVEQKLMEKIEAQNETIRINFEEIRIASKDDIQDSKVSIRKMINNFEVILHQGAPKEKKRFTEIAPRPKELAYHVNKVTIYQHEQPLRVKEEQKYLNCSSASEKDAIRHQQNERIDRIEAEMCLRVANLENQLKRVLQKHEIFEEQTGIIMRKVQKNNQKISTAVSLFEKSDEKKTDDKAMEIMQTALKKAVKQLEQGMDTKVSKEQFCRQKSKLEDKIQEAVRFIDQKMDRQEFKKGYLFLQDKIKDLILVFADQQNQENDGAVKRAPFKCLSCNKDLEVSQSYTSKKSKESTNLRSITTRIRRRVKLINSQMPTEECLQPMQSVPN